MSDADAFPATRHTLVRGLIDADADRRRRALDSFARDYHAPMVRYVGRRFRVSDEDARDLVQGFFVDLQERDVLARYDAERARLRGYVRMLLDRWAANRFRDAKRHKRGGDAKHADVDDLDVAVDADADAIFRDEWVRRLFELALEDLRADAAANGRTTQIAVFEAYDLADADDRPTYAQLAARMDVAVTKVTNDLHAARRRLRARLLERLADLCDDEDQWRVEARELLGIEVG